MILLAGTDYLSSVEAGTEVFTGRAQLDTRAYSTDVGWSENPPLPASNRGNLPVCGGN